MVMVWKAFPLDYNHQIGNSLKTTKSFNSWLDNSPIPGTGFQTDAKVAFWRPLLFYRNFQTTGSSEKTELGYRYRLKIDKRSQRAVNIVRFREILS